MTNRSKMKPKKRSPWFVAVRGSYLPCSWQGWLLYVPYIGMLIASYVSVKNEANTVLELALAMLPIWVAITVVMTWIASVTSNK